MSRFQARVLSLLREILGLVVVRTEVNVRDLFPEHYSGREHYDLVVPSLNLIVECHGEQHEQLVTFGGDPRQSHTRLSRQRFRDRRKEETALSNGWNYVAVWYREITGNDEEDLALLRAKLERALK